jgi:hypothetical protein
MKQRLNQRLAKQVRHLLEKSRYPSVEVKKSCLSGAGRGVFSRLSVSDEMLPMVACLYPGIYTPGIPHVDSAEIGNDYLADQIPPSQIPFENNEYIMNLQDKGGYVDGSSLENCNGRRLDTNPSACGHFVNHDACNANTYFVSFAWDYLLVGFDLRHGTINTNLFALPNDLRRDGSPWYFDGTIHRFENLDKEPLPSVCGGAIVISKPLDSGDELLLDYGLRKPYPSWAKDWYK